MKPEINSRWKHKNGNVYTVFMYANEDCDKDDYPLTIIYKDQTGKVYSRAFDQSWYRSRVEIQQEFSFKHNIDLLNQIFARTKSEN